MDTKEMIQNYWDYRSKTYTNGPIDEDSECRESWKKLLSSHLGASKGINVLDVGTGPGFLALLFSEMGCNVTAVDLSGEMLARAAENATRRGMAIRLYQGDAEKLPFPDECFDIVANKHLLWTLPDPEKAVYEWKRVLRKNGTILAIDGEWHRLSVVGRIRKRIYDAISERKNDYMRLYKAQYGPIKDKLPLYSLTPAMVSQLFTRCGLADVSVKAVDSSLMSRKKSLVEKIAPNSPVYVISGRKPD